MTVIFEEKQKEKGTLEEVEENQFFVNCDGYLCQKSSPTSYNLIAKADGSVFSSTVENIPRTIKIERLLQKVAKIEF